MNFRDAMKHLLNGEKVRRKIWQNESFLYISVSGYLFNQSGNPSAVSRFSAEASDWQIWQPPEPPLVDWNAAVKALKEGKRVRRKRWPKEDFLSKREDARILLNDITYFNFVQTEWILAEDWQILEN
jgi:hypothetical protein